MREKEREERKREREKKRESWKFDEHKEVEKGRKNMSSAIVSLNSSGQLTLS